MDDRAITDMRKHLNIRGSCGHTGVSATALLRPKYRVFNTSNRWNLVF